jgi:hypothetical protein
MELSKLPIGFAYPKYVIFNFKAHIPPFGKNDSTVLIELTIDRVDF